MLILSISCGLINTIPVGTYRGVTNIDEILKNLGPEFPGDISDNEITVIVSEDGTVTGDLLVTWIGTRYDLPNVEGDYYQITNIITSGIISGKLSDVDGIISIKMTEAWKVFFSADSELEPVNREEFYDLKADIHFNEYDMFGDYGYVEKGYRSSFEFQAIKD